MLAGAGIVFARVDVRGTGDSEGVLTDEYSEAELAGVLAHEITHVTERHGISELEAQSTRINSTQVHMRAYTDAEVAAYADRIVHLRDGMLESIEETGNAASGRGGHDGGTGARTAPTREEIKKRQCPVIY